MKVYKNINEFDSKSKTILTLGTFDGVHLGHQQILNQIVSLSKNTYYESVVLTFFPHPRNVIENNELFLLNTLFEKEYLLEKVGINHLIIHPFDKKFSEYSPEDFVKEILVDQLNIGTIVIGHDHRFGKNRSADINDLKFFGEKYGFEVIEISAQQIKDVNVSSTRIRNALFEGNISLANSYLGYNYFFTGQVIEGKQIGRTISFPTANISIYEDYKLIPKKGVYLVQSTIQNVSYFGVMNIGVKPTFGENELSIEVFYLNLNQDLYHQNIKVEILDFIREETKFDNIDALKIQIRKDVTKAQELISLKFS